MKNSPRQKLYAFYGDGRLRDALERARLDEETIQLAVDVLGRYCSPRRK